MTDAVVEIVLEKLFSFAGTVVGLFLGFNQEKERLESMLKAIKAALHDAEEKQFSSKAIKDWLGKLKHTASELEDILDECAYEALDYQEESNKVGNRFLPLMNSFFTKSNPTFRYEITKKMKSISERLKEINDERTQFHLTDLTVQKITSGVPEWRQTMSSTIEPRVYGREEDTKRIVTSLIGYADAFHSENLLVYPIVGQGGLGKTTLAQLIYKDERVVDYFEPIMWVCVSEDFSWRRMIKAIIEAASGKKCEDLDLEPLRKRLQDQLRSKTYLLVLDDVWDDNPDNWQTLRSVLDCGAKGASILVTTRLSTVASIMGTLPPYELSLLSENDCWELFKCRAFGPNETEPVELVDIGKAIVKKCGGVPLAAKALGAFLRFERKEQAWLNVLESNIWRLEDSIMPALRLSYLNLPVKLRPCFAYCAIFPKDERIRKQDLVELWMANGFISSEGRLDAEHVGDGVWHELYWRSFFQDIERDETGQVTRFKMHDLVHDLAQSIAEDVCCITTDNGVTTEPAETIQHISDHRRSWSEPEELINSMHQVKYLRTYICEHDASIAQFSAHILKRYPLRVLQRGGIQELSSSIGDLKHLRYLNLSSGKFETLPESLGKLWNLLILKLDICENLQKLPNSLVHLKALQQLSLNGCFRLSSLAPEIGKLSSLRILSKYIVGKERGFLLSELGPLKLKGDLRIEHLENVQSIADAKEANMSIKQLKELELSWETNEEWELQENVEEILEVLQPDTQHLKSLYVQSYKGVHLPQWMFTSPSLKNLRLSHLPNLESLPDCIGSLPLLEELNIWKCEKLRCLPTSLSLLTSLKKLSLIHLPNLESLPDCIGSLPLLKKLNIMECEKLRCLPTSLSLLTSLKKLSLIHLPNLESLPDCIGSLPLLDLLYVRECEKLRCLPTSLSLLTSLKMLWLWGLPNLESLPDCIGSLPLLEELRIYECEKLRCLPTSLSLLTSLKYLFIQGCPELEKRCEKETGEDWPKIAHIPHIYMDGRNII